MRWASTAIFASVGLLLMVIALPLIRRRVPPNGLYGVRFPQRSPTRACGTR